MQESKDANSRPNALRVTMRTPVAVSRRRPQPFRVIAQAYVQFNTDSITLLKNPIDKF
jgi:hypothetical protein